MKSGSARHQFSDARGGIAQDSSHTKRIVNDNQCASIN